jgi:hypothetical protein
MGSGSCGALVLVLVLVLMVPVRDDGDDDGDRFAARVGGPSGQRDGDRPGLVAHPAAGHPEREPAPFLALEAEPLRVDDRETGCGRHVVLRRIGPGQVQNGDRETVICTE